MTGWTASMSLVTDWVPETPSSLFVTFDVANRLDGVSGTESVTSDSEAVHLVIEDRFDVAGHRLGAGDAIEPVCDLRRRVLEFLRVRCRERDVDRLRTGRRTLAEHLDVTDALEVVELLLQIRGDRLRRDAGLRVDDIGAGQ